MKLHEQRGKAVLVEFSEFCRVNNLRTLPYLKAWHERYAKAGLRVIGVHTGGFPPARDEDNVRRAVERLEIPWPGARSTLTSRSGTSTATRAGPRATCGRPTSTLYSMHYGEGAYAKTEREIQTLLGVTGDPVPPVHPEDAEDALIVPQTEDQPGPYSGPYEAGGVWAVVDGFGAHPRQRA